MIGKTTRFDKTMAKEKARLQHAFEAMTNADLNCFTWSSYHASESELDLHGKTGYFSAFATLLWKDSYRCHG